MTDIFKKPIDKINSEVQKKINKFLETYNFLFDSIHVFGSTSSIIKYCRNDDFILILIENIKKSNHMQGFEDFDSPEWGISVRVGNGGSHYPEYFWSSVKVDDYLSLDDSKYYKFDKIKHLNSSIEDILGTLLNKYNKFLTGDLSEFFQKRALMVNSKNVEKIIMENTKSGEVTYLDDTEGQSFKEKYLR